MRKKLNTQNPSFREKSKDNKEDVLLAQEGPLDMTSHPWKKRFWLALGSITLISLGGGISYGWIFIREHLSPMVEERLSNFLNRPVKLGEVEGLSLVGVRFGESEILATPTDPAKVSLEAVEVKINPFKLISESSVALDVQAIKPKIYLEQGVNYGWLRTQFDEVKPQKIKIKLDTLRLKDAQVVLVARSQKRQLNSPVKLFISSGKADFTNQGKTIDFDLMGDLNKGGRVKVSGIGKTNTQEINLIVSAQEIPSTELGELIPLPLALQKGKVSGNLDIKLKLAQTPIPWMQGVATLDNVTAKIPQLPQSFSQGYGTLRFRERDITLENVSAKFGDLKGVANGSFNLTGNYNLEAKTQPFFWKDAVNTLKLNPPDVPISGQFNSRIEVRGLLQNPQVNLEVINTKPLQVDQVQFKDFQGNFKVNAEQINLTHFQALPTLGGELSGQGIIKHRGTHPQFIVTAKGTDLPSQKIARLYQTTLPLSVGNVNGEITVKGLLKGTETLQATGSANFPFAGGYINAHNIEYQGRNWRGKVQGFNLELANLGINLPQNIPNGRINTQLNLSGESNKITPATIQGKGIATLRLAEGKITAKNLQFNQGNWQTDLETYGLELKQIVPNLPPKFQGLVSGNFTVKGDFNSTLADIQGQGAGILTLNEGIIRGENLQLNQGQWKANLQTDNFPLTQWVSPGKFTKGGTLSANLNLRGNLTSNLKDIQGNGQASLNLASGRINAPNITLNQGQFKTFLTADQLKLAQVSPQFKGYLGGGLNLSGALDNIDLTAIKATGNLYFSQGIPLINRSLNTLIGWDGKRLEIQQATAENFTAKGFIDLDSSVLLNNSNLLSSVKGFNFQVKGDNINLKELPLTLPRNIEYNGSLDFDGKLLGTLQKPTLDGKIAVNDLSFAHLNFEPVLKGSIQVLESGVSLNLGGDRDQIKVDLNSAYQPVSFKINLDQNQLEGSYNTDQKLWLATAENISLGLVKEWVKTQDNLAKNKILSQPLEGQFSGDFAFNWSEKKLSGKNLVITHPHFAGIKGDRLTANFSLSPQEFILSEAKFQRDQSQYNINARITQTAFGPQLNSEIAIIQGQIQDILEPLQFFEISDFSQGEKTPIYTKVKDLWTEANTENSTPLYSVGIPNQSLLEQLEYFAKINASVADNKERRQRIRPLPELQDLEGKFSGNVSLDASLKQGINAKFALQGQDWKWGEIDISQVQAKGNYDNGSLTFEPLRIDLDKSILTFAGQLAEKNQSGTLQLINIPLEKVQKWVTLPPNINLEGLLNAEINIGGNRDNPQMKGKIAIANGKLNQTPIEATQGEFIYENSRFSFLASSLLTPKTEPLTLEGSIPYQLPFAKVAPASDQLNLNIRVKNNGLSLLNILTQGQINWVDGQGEINLGIVGQFDQNKNRITALQTEGIVTVENGKIDGQILANIPLTQVKGKILFNSDQIDVESFTGQFSGGQVTIAGILPLIQSQPVEKPLTINAQDLTLNLKEYYQGNVNGTVQVTGSLLQPAIGGTINLYEGQILLGEKSNIASKKQGLITPEFKNLQLNLGDNIWVTQSPVLNFLASGNLAINGTLNQLKPDGTIKLKAGQINVFSAQFGLLGGEENTVTFTPSRGLDPYLNIRLLAVVSETTRNTVRTNPLSSEINDKTTFPTDSLQTVRIEAKIEGLGSQLSNNIQLTSIPPRSENEIIALLGGGFINTFSEKDATFGLANLASSAVLGTFQGSISKALGLSDFRVYPTQLINDQERIANDQIGITAEASIDVRKDLSVSIQKIVNTDRPPQFGLRYRINQNTVIRGSTNFSDDSRGIIEYERRF